MKKLLSCFALMFAFTVNANAKTLTFDDITSGKRVPVSNGYGGFNWTGSAKGIYSMPKKYHSGTGYDHGALSSNTLFNAYGASGNTITSVGGVDFTFNSAYFTSAVSEKLTISFEGWRDGHLAFTSKDFEINSVAPILITLNWSKIDSLKILNPVRGYWAMGSFTFNEAIVAQTPIPAAVWLFGSALGGLVGFGKRKKA